MADPLIAPFVQDCKDGWHRANPRPSILTSHILKYGDRLPTRCREGDYLAILKLSMDELRPDDLIIPLTTGNAEQHSDFPRTTSPGYPWNFRGFKTKRDVLADEFSVNSIHRTWDMIGRGNFGVSLPPCTAFHRSVASPVDKTKVRLTWGYPIDVILEEFRFFWPLFDKLKEDANRKDFFYGLGLETALGGHTHIRRHFDCAPVGTKVLNADLSEFDQHVPDWVIRDIFQYMSTWFDFSRVVDTEGKVWKVNPDQTRLRWRAMVSYFVKTKIRMPEGGTVQKFQGVPSGSCWTNVIDTIVNCVQMRTVARRQGLHIHKDYYYGDDSTILLAPPSPIDISSFSEELRSSFGGILHPDKTELFDVPEGIHWLGYYATTPSQGATRPLGFIVGSTLYPEREVSTPLESCARLLGQAYSTMNAHDSIPFLRAVTYLRVKYGILPTTIDEYVRTLPSKHLKFLTTLGLRPSDITVPPTYRDDYSPYYRLRCDKVLPRLPNRALVNSPHMWHLDPEYLPEHAVPWYTQSMFYPSDESDFESLHSA